MTIPLVTGLIAQLTQARLGETRDPRALVPGDPESIVSSATALDRYGVDMEDNGQDLRRVQVSGWQGPAANAFWDSFAQEPPRWLLGGDAMAGASAVLQQHADVLSWGQAEAERAIRLWDDGESVTEQARNEHNAVVANIQAQASAVTSTVNRILPLEVPQFFDPGAAIRQEAEEILNRARAQVEESGARAAAQLRSLSGESSDAPGWLSQAANVVATAAEDYDTGQGALKFDELGNFKDWEVTLGKLETERLQVWGWDGEGETQLGDVTLSGSAEVNTLGVAGTAGLSLTGSDGLKAELGGEAYLVHAAAEGSAEYGIAEVGAKGEVFVGAEAGAEASIGPDGVHLGAEAFAGARAEGEIYGDVGGVGVGAKGEAWAGVGAEASATFGRNDDGTWTIGAEAGAALKLGGKLGFEVTVDPPKIADTVVDAAGAVGDFAGGVVDTVKFW